MNVVKLDGRFRGTEWRQAFASRLIQLRPDMNPDAADEVSDSQFLESSFCSPSLAAERYAAGVSVDDHPDEASNGSLVSSGERALGPNR